MGLARHLYGGSTRIATVASSLRGVADAAAGSRSSHFREDANRCTVGVLWLAGIPGRRQSRPPLATSLSEAELIATAERLERAYDREARIVALEIPDREAILRVLEDCPEEMLELRATLLQEHVWRKREGLG